MSSTFGPPHNWCDANCKHCPIASTCPLSAWLLRQEDADEENESAATDDASDGAASDPFHVEGQSEYIEALVALLSRAKTLPAESRAAVEELFAMGCLISAKTSRLLHAEIGDLVWASDTIPNLLLFEHAVARVRYLLQSLEPLRTSTLQRFVAAHRAFIAQLEPLRRAIPPTARSELAQLCAAAAAPSPFCQT